MDNKSGWRHLSRIKFNKKHLSRRMRKVEGVTLRHAHKFIIGRWDNIREVRKHIITWLIGVALLIVVVGAQIVWFQRGYTLSAPVSGGVYAEAVNGPVETLNPLYATTSAEVASSKLIFSSLFDYDSTGHLRGDLATSLKVDPNGLDYTVTLRPSSKWHNGDPVTVQDVIFTVGLMKDPSVRAVSSLRQAWRDVMVTPVGESAVKFTLPNPNAAFPHALTFAVLPQQVLKDIEPNLLRESSFSTAPVGSGPFQIKRFQLVNQSEDRKIVHMSAFPDYYKGEPKLNRFQLHVYGSDKAILNALRTGEVNAVADIDSHNLSEVNQSHYQILPKPVNSGIYALFNTTGAILKDKPVRQALQAAANTAELRKKLGGDRHSMDLPFADRQLLGTDIPKAPPYDQAKAGTLLDQAGWIIGNGKRMKAGQPLKLRMVTVADDVYEPTLKELADQWRQIGVETELLVIDPADQSQDFTQILKDRDYDVLINRLNIGGDPDVYAYWHSSQATPLGKNYSNYSNSISDTALSSALTKPEPVERDTRYKAFARQWIDDAPAIGLYQANMYYVHSKNIQTILDDENIVSPIDRYGSVIHWAVERGQVYKTP
jgi:peptide/nickel transport system substrate-binding protein